MKKWYTFSTTQLERGTSFSHSLLIIKYLNKFYLLQHSDEITYIFIIDKIKVFPEISGNQYLIMLLIIKYIAKTMVSFIFFI